LSQFLSGVDIVDEICTSKRSVMHQHYEIQSMSQGDDTLFDHYGEILFAYIRAHTATREDAEDLTVEVFAAALEHDNLSTLPGSTAQLAWLKKVAHNKLIDHYRWRQRHPKVDLDRLTGTLLDEDTLPEEMALRSETQRELREHISKLSALQQLVLQLRYGNDMRCPEIAQFVGKSSGAVRQILARTIQELRKHYRSQHQGSGEENV
jgi:RNA polymerase sigma-70 factor, ECF subfamily